jgi:dipeptidyl aminopeptidase/acylaminoacyl peptidase
MVVSAVHAAKSPITMDDMLNAEGTGRKAMFSPDNQTFAFVRSIPIARQGTWGYDDDELVRSRVFVRKRGASTATEIPNTPDIHYSLAPDRTWSPDGRQLLLIATTREGYGLAVYDVKSDKVVVLPGHIDNFFPTFDWTGDGRIIYFALPKGVHQRGNNNLMLENVNAHWREAWNGDAPQVTVSSESPVFRTSEPPAGALILADPRRGTSSELATGDYYAVSVSPGRQYVAAIRGAEREPKSLNFHGRRGELQLFAMDNSSNGAALAHKYDQLDVSIMAASGASMAWSPSGARLLVVGSRPGDDTSTAPYVVTAVDGGIHKLASPGLSFVNPSASDWGMTLPVRWIGDQPAAIAASEVKPGGRAEQGKKNAGVQLEYGAAAGKRLDLHVFGEGTSHNLTGYAKASVDDFLVPSGMEYALVVADGAVWKVAPDHSPERLSSADAPSITGFGIDRRYPAPPAQSAYFHAGRQERVGVYALISGKPQRAVLDVTSGKVVPIKVRGRIMATAPDQLATLSRINEGWASSLSLNDGGEHIVLAVNEELKDRAEAEVRPFHFTYKGEKLGGWVVLPPGAKPGSPLPAVVSVYGGTVYGADPDFMATAEISIPIFSGQLLATQGYAVVYPSTPLGKGADSDLMDTLANELVAAIDALAEEGVVDPKRVGIMGQSFGGFSTVAVLTKRSDRFRAGIAMAGIYDWVSGYGAVRVDTMLSDSGDIYGPEIKMIEDGQIQLQKPFWESMAAYRRNSPIFDIPSIRTPLLFLHGDLDMAITGLPGAMRMYNAMVRAGKTTALVHYWGQGHVAQSASAIRDQWSRITMWFDHYLKDGMSVENQNRGQSALSGASSLARPAGDSGPDAPDVSGFDGSAEVAGSR